MLHDVLKVTVLGSDNFCVFLRIVSFLLRRQFFMRAGQALVHFYAFLRVVALFN